MNYTGKIYRLCIIVSEALKKKKKQKAQILSLSKKLGKLNWNLLAMKRRACVAYLKLESSN